MIDQAAMTAFENEDSLVSHPHFRRRPIGLSPGKCRQHFGIIGTGLLAIPVLAGSTAHAIGEGRRWKVGLSRKPKQAIAFYAVLGFSGLCGIGLNFTPIDPIQAIYWSAVVNGVPSARP
jgi:hypothetical protein